MNTFSLTATVLLAASFLGGCAAAPRTTPLASGAAAARTPEPALAPRVVEGDLDIANRSSLRGFENLEVVTGTLTIVGNTRLSSLEGLEHLKVVKNLVVKENLSLTTLEGLSSLRHARSVTIEGNPRLQNLRGLESLRQVDRLVVTKNGIYCTTGLGGLTEAREVVITSNPRLLSLRGLKNLETVERVSVTNNPRLSAHSGMLDSLRQVSGVLEIRDNAGLQASEVDAVRDRLPSVVQHGLGPVETVTVATR